MSHRWNQYNFSTLHRLFLREHRWILVLLLIYVDWYIHSKTDVAGSKYILNRFWCITWRSKAIFFIKMSTLHNGLHNKFWASCFCYLHWFWIWNISIIHFAKFEVYTCSICDHSNKCLFLVIQDAEVLQNFFGECMLYKCRGSPWQRASCGKMFPCHDVFILKIISENVIIFACKRSTCDIRCVGTALQFG